MKENKNFIYQQNLILIVIKKITGEYDGKTRINVFGLGQPNEKILGLAIFKKIAKQTVMVCFSMA